MGATIKKWVDGIINPSDLLKNLENKIKEWKKKQYDKQEELKSKQSQLEEKKNELEKSILLLKRWDDINSDLISRL